MRYPRRSDSVTGKIRSDTIPDLADLAFLDATAQAELVQKKKLNPLNWWKQPVPGRIDVRRFQPDKRKKSLLLSSLSRD
jgi:hypothetical protein